MRPRISLYGYRLEVLEHLLPDKADPNIERRRMPVSHIPKKKILDREMAENMPVGDARFVTKIRSGRRQFTIAHLVQERQPFVLQFFMKIIKTYILSIVLS